MHVAVLSSVPIERLGSLDISHLKRLAADGTISLGSDTVRPATATPDGFVLFNPGYRRSDYVYDSDVIYATDFVNGAKAAEVTMQLHEYVYGNNSHVWRLTTNAKTLSNAKHLTWTFRYKYYCGVNVSGGNDYECNNNASASGVEVPFNPGENFNESWGATNSITVFPMAAMSIHWSTGDVATMKFRGYDTLSRTKTTRLNTSSGNGH